MITSSQHASISPNRQGLGSREIQNKISGKIQLDGSTNPIVGGREKEIIEKDERESKLDQEIKDLKETIKELETKLFDNRKEFKEF